MLPSRTSRNVEEKNFQHGDMVHNEFSIGYCPDIACYEPLLVRNETLIDEKGCSQNSRIFYFGTIYIKNMRSDHIKVQYVSCHACGKTFKVENLINLKPLTSNEMRDRLLAENLQYRIKTLPSRSNYPEFVRLNGISPFLYKLNANLLTDFGFDSGGIVRPLKFLQTGCSVFGAENLSCYSHTIDDKFLLTKG
uniref:Deubiquitinating protein VCPIP1 N-terminal domain-containing protein n=1 Tax=Romanomermis culicivorax TaxID=13658 RepID=A0A915LAC0_ROMCU